MTVYPETIDAFKACMEDPSSFGLDFPPLGEIVEASDDITPKHVLYDEYMKAIGGARNIPKMVFYVIMDDKYPIGKAGDGNLGYKAGIKKPSAQC